MSGLLRIMLGEGETWVKVFLGFHIDSISFGLGDSDKFLVTSAHKNSNKRKAIKYRTAVSSLRETHSSDAVWPKEGDGTVLEHECSVFSSTDCWALYCGLPAFCAHSQQDSI